jgi:hypothetical protein
VLHPVLEPNLAGGGGERRAVTVVGAELPPAPKSVEEERASSDLKTVW